MKVYSQKIFYVFNQLDLLNFKSLFVEKKFLSFTKMEDRVRTLHKADNHKNVLYLMRRDQRIVDNHSVLFGYDLSYKHLSKFYILCDYKSLTLNHRQQTFVKKGLEEVFETAKKFNLYFNLVDNLEKHVNEFDIDCIILDFSPLRQCLEYQEKVKKFCVKNNIALHQCDSHNIVPCWMLDTYKRTSKAVKTILFKFQDRYFKDFKELEVHKYNNSKETSTVDINWSKVFSNYKSISTKRKLKDEDEKTNKKSKIMEGDEKTETKGVKKQQIIQIAGENSFTLKKAPEKVFEFRGGYKEGMQQVERFFKEKFKDYAANRNNPNNEVLSNLSPWLHTGQISALKVVLLARKRFSSQNNNLQTFINEIFAFRETAEHFCYHEKNYDSIEGALVWAKESLLKHSNDKRTQIYTFKELEAAKTKDSLWNAGQKQLLISGKMHGYVRMYWAKQILKWTNSPEEAVEYGILLNDKYSIDGNDPNGYLGVMWSICGAMDQGFKERDVIGKIRPMNAFVAPEYIDKWVTRNVDDYIVD